MTKTVTRLYNYFQPTKYGLVLTINKESMTFTGRVMIQGKKVGKPSQRLTFHQKGLKFTQASVTRHDKKGDQQFEIGRINTQKSYDEVRLHSEAMLYPGDYTVVIDFEGSITKAMHGIYPCFFKDDGQDKKLIATQFESHFAREAFPCIDEPEAKATFDLTLVSAAGETVIANTPVIDTNIEGNLQINTFATTPKMSTYLLAFVMGDMGYQDATTKNGTVVRGYATPDKAAFTKSCVSDGVKILEYFEDYFDVPYPLQKLDLVALPDFTVGAMENWGLVTFRESMFLVDPDSTSIETRQISAMIIAHELSHQWFGNLVTMKWWDDLWLNESFANMMEYMGMDAAFPEWNVWEQFVSRDGVSAKRRDSLVDVQSVHIDVNHPDEINTVFDPSIVYAKGGNLLYMLMHYLGQDTFRDGLRIYFKKHAYGNTVAADLWAALSQASGQNIAEFMDNWLSKPGYPIVDVEWEPGTCELTLSQKRFLTDPAVIDTQKTIWQVPLAATGYATDVDMLTTKELATSITYDADDKTLLLNHDGTSYFLPHYTNEKHLQQIKSTIPKLSTIDRLLLLDNYTLLQRGGEASTVELLDLVSGYTAETNENVWGLLAMSIGEVRRLIEGNEQAEATLNAMVQKLVKPMLPKLGWDDNPNDDAQTLHLRGLMYSLAAGAKVQEVIDEGLARFARMKKPSDLPASTRGISYFAAARYGTTADFERLLQLYQTVGSHDDKDELAGGFTSVKQPNQIQTVLAFFKTDVRNQDVTHLIAWLIRNRHARAATWQWIQDEWAWLEAELGGDKSYDYLPRYSAAVFSRADELTSYSAFFEPKKSNIELQRAIILGEQEITGRIAWRERNEAAVKAYLS